MFMNLKNVNEFRYVDEFKIMFMISKKCSRFQGNKSELYLIDTTQYDHGY